MKFFSFIFESVLIMTALSVFIFLTVSSISHITQPSGHFEEETIERVVNESISKQNYNLKIEDGYTLVIQSEDTLVLKDGTRTVHIFTRHFEPNSSLFYVIDRDNQ